jgi:hypothetical protein
MLRRFLFAILICALIATSPTAAAQRAPEDAALGTGDLPDGFTLSSADRSQQLGTDFYTVVYHRALDPGETVTGPWLIANVVGVGGSGDLDLAMAFFLSRFPAPPSRPVLPATQGPPIGDAWNWLGFDATLDGAPVSAHAVAFRVQDYVAVVAVAGPDATADETVELARVVEGRLGTE